MDVVMVLLVTLFVLKLFQGLVMLSRRRKRLPPGPLPLPLMGNLHLLGALPHKSLAKLAQTHGPIMSLKLGQVTTVVISSSSLARQVLQKQDLLFSSRSIPDAVNAHDHSKYSVVWLPVASRWRSLRKIMNSNIFSINKLDANQDLRSKKVEELIAYCKKSSTSETGEAIDIGRAAFRTSLNLLSTTIFSKDLTDPYSDSAKEFKELVSNIMVEVGRPNLVDYFPILGRMDPQGVRRRMSVHFGEVLNLFHSLITQRLESQAVLPKIDILDTLLTIAHDYPQELDTPHIQHLCLDLIVAGTDTTSNTLEWAMTELLRNSEAMKKAKEELGQVIGKGRIIKETDIPNLPYLQCIVKETLRLHPSAPFLIPRRVEKDVEVSEYVVPKGSQVLVNVWAIGRDPCVWENPLTFKPERFHESDMDVKGRDFELIPFGAGRRICPGLPLAMRMVPLMLGSLLNCFDWKLEEGMTPEQLNMEERFGVAMQKAQPLMVIPVSS